MYQSLSFFLFSDGDCRYTRKFAPTCMSVKICILYDYTYMLSKHENKSKFPE